MSVATHRASVTHWVDSHHVNLFLRNALEGRGTLGLLHDALGRKESLLQFLSSSKFSQSFFVQVSLSNLSIANEHVFGDIFEDLNTKKIKSYYLV